MPAEKITTLPSESAFFAFLWSKESQTPPPIEKPDITSQGILCLSKASDIANAFITVASIPIWSPVILFMPFKARLAPRKILPPPITIATSTPKSRAD